jgi:ribose transport system permease protein
MFSIWVPSTFLTRLTFSSTLSTNVVVGLVSLGLVFPLVTGVYDLSIGFTLGLSSTIVAVLNVNEGMAAWEAVVVAVIVGVLIGCVNGFLIVKLHIDSFMATLGMGSVLGGLILLIGGANQIVGLSVGLGNLAAHQWFEISLPVFLLIVIALVMWYVLEQTPSGRFFQATGGGKDAARLAGIQTDRYIFLSLIVSAVMGTIAGIVLTAQLQSSSPDYATQYLLPGFAAAFLGATQLKRGRPNVWGTLIAVFVLGIGTEGFNLVGVQSWINDVFYGAALLIAVGLSVFQRRPKSVTVTPDGTDGLPSNAAAHVPT